MNMDKILCYCTSALSALLGLGAVVYGCTFIFGPDGSLSGLSAKLLAKTPFESFLIPGNIFFFLIGMGSITVGYLCILRHRYAGVITMVSGLLLILWTLMFLSWFGWCSYLLLFFLLGGPALIVLGFALMVFLEDDDKDFWKDSPFKDFIPRY